MKPLPLGSKIGILGDGQLGRMLSQAASRLGFKVVVYGPDAESPAASVSAVSKVARYTDEAALDRFAAASDVITFEFENVPVASLDYLVSKGAKVAPDARALGITQDRILEKRFARSVGIGTVDFYEINSLDDLEKAIAANGLPALLKTRREGYDGKGQVWIRAAEEAKAAFDSLNGRPAILEAKADFQREVSVIAARGYDGTVKTYPVGENHHVSGILSTTLAPAVVSDTLKTRAEMIARKVLEGLDYVGVLGVELFVLEGDALILNEIAPRVHNTGHWTQDGCLCDQFEQHIRAVAGWPLGDTTARFQVEMTNLLGPDVLAWEALSQEPDSRLYIYGKDDPRPGRKMGHINRLKASL
ncbi:5-(carboxyamino)imidazole ribonucleotide synthase [Asticcacaulis sp. DW145]|uniref:N5-carboxyaminoimidazole ribonucleotide synthase n=1 Tax=Asticcacaulis currens TaxID=2984210 RepID=A0ABT5IG74_9CAUL|nr:5-(carboxyamino)imidazole ribonucleotide synthase [Asticcacaulis currens]MDC7694855.1 5-(carboxyamino)imidazole ribonucleotide synthase [Asticcacaulis currens]BEV12008.1 5-(carboxyamino)imidazole ribonucleotide synthase [Asticcacaulis sp. DW145]